IVTVLVRFALERPACLQIRKRNLRIGNRLASVRNSAAYTRQSGLRERCDCTERQERSRQNQVHRSHSHKVFLRLKTSHSILYGPQPAACKGEGQSRRHLQRPSGATHNFHKRHKLYLRGCNTTTSNRTARAIPVRSGRSQPFSWQSEE